MVPLWFSNQHEITTATFLTMFIRLLQHFTLPLLFFALGYFFFFLSSFFERMNLNLTDDKNEFNFFIFLENAAERCWKSGKKYVERDCRVVNSCHLYVLICVYLFLGFVSIVELAVIIFFIEFDSNEATIVVILIAADFWNCYQRCWEISVCLYSISF